MNTETILNTIRLWKEYPEKAQASPVVTARANESQAVIEAGSFSWRADLPGLLGGSNLAPSPTLLLLSALAGCAVVFIRDTLGPMLNVRITDVRATARRRTDFRGLLGVDGAPPDLEDTVWAEIQPTERARRLAEQIPDAYGLTAADALQLAAAMIWCDERPRGRPFVVLDERLAAAAGTVGFTPVP